MTDRTHTVHESHLGQAKVSKLDVTHQCDQQTRYKTHKQHGSHTAEELLQFPILVKYVAKSQYQNCKK